MSNGTKLKTWPNVPFKTWEYEKQTEMKHKVFSYYLPLWLQILGKFFPNLNYIDGFSGIGAYHTDKDVKEGRYTSFCYGSPILSTSAVSKLEKNKKIEKANVIIIDKDAESIENIKKILDFEKLTIKGMLHLQRGDFDKEINELLDTIKKGSKIAPTFFLLDPFGFCGIKLNTIKRIMMQERTEILLNFMYNSIQKAISNPNRKVQEICVEYFGASGWKKYCKDKTYIKEQKIVQFFRKKCKCFCNFVYPFRLKFPTKNRTYYYLFHLTNHRYGCSLMKDTFARFNNGRDQYLGERFQSGLFDDYEKKEKRENFIKKIISKYAGEKKKYQDIITDFIDETDLLEREIKKILNLLENDKKIKVIPIDKRKRRTGFKDTDIIVFR